VKDVLDKRFANVGESRIHRYQGCSSTSCLATTWWRKAAAETGVAGVSGEAIIGAALNDDVARKRRQICWVTRQIASTTRHTTTLTATAAADTLFSSDFATTLY